MFHQEIIAETLTNVEPMILKLDVMILVPLLFMLFYCICLVIEAKIDQKRAKKKNAHKRKGGKKKNETHR